MSTYRETFQLAFTTADTDGTEDSPAVPGLERFDWFQIDAKLIGPTGGTLDVVLQREVGAVGSGVWRDWLRFPQVAAGATKYYSAQSGAAVAIQEVGDDETPVLAANTFVGGHPGAQIRALFISGAGATTGAAQVIDITCWKRRL